jgi:hypothetical protein
MFRTTVLAVVTVAVLMSASSLIAGGYHDYGPHAIGVFLGDTRFGGNSALTLGVDYEYRWNATAGIGLLFEYDISDSLAREYLFGIPFYAHPYGGLRLAFVPIYVVEDIDGDKVNRGAVRVGVAYAIETGSFIVTPGISFDFLSDTAYTVYGLGFGFMF